METMDTPGSVSKKLKPLDSFQPPVHRYEGIGRYINEQGQEFELRIGGVNPELVEEYMKAVRVSFEVLPAAEELPEEEEPAEAGYEQYLSFVEEQYKQVTLQPELDLEIDLEVVNTQGIELPYELNVEIDPNIAGGATHYYVTKTNAKTIKINLSASNNGVSGYLSGGGISAVRDQADTYPPNPPKTKAKFKGTAGSPSRFYFSVTGLKATNKYSIGSSTKLVK